MTKLDLKKQYKSYYTAKTKPEYCTFEAAQYLSILGKGDPDAQVYADRVKALFTVTYGVKFAYKAQEKDFVVSKLEGHWWFDENKFGVVTLGEAPALIPRSEWYWRMMIRMPDYVEASVLDTVIEQVVEKKGISLAKEVELFATPSKSVVQMLHIGPFDREPETLEKMWTFITANKLKKAGKHHEIYLSDITRAAPEKWRTILREPVESL